MIDAVSGLRAGRIRFVIAHRLSTVRQADRIIVLDRGRVEGIGTHDELLECSSLYVEMSRQLAAPHV